MKKRLLAFVVICAVVLCGCRNRNGQNTEDAVIEPTESFTWEAGKSLVDCRRIGIKRAGVNNADYAIAPNGVYFMERTDQATEEGKQISYVLYTDYGSDTVIKLCGRVDCNHHNRDCNAYIEAGNNIYYYNEYLYAVSGVGGTRGGDVCRLIRMDMDGANHTTIFDLNQFAQKLGHDFAQCDMIDNGECLFSVFDWKETSTESSDEKVLVAEYVQSYRYALDGSMKEPQLIQSEGGHLYHCGDVFLTLVNGARNGGYNGCDLSLWDWDMKTDTITYLTDHPGIAGFYGRNAGIYFRNGNVVRLNYKTRQEECLIETGLNGNYYVMCFPDCLVVADQSFTAEDNHLYIYNWAYELVDTVELTYLHGGFFTDQALMAETMERFILTDGTSWIPKYYIEKKELGTGDVKVHAFDLPDSTGSFES